jgi:hypothetical protein
MLANKRTHNESAKPSPKVQTKMIKVAVEPLLSEELRDPRSLTNQRVAKHFPVYSENPFFGTITACEYDHTEGSHPFWVVTFDDGDQEDFDEFQVQEAIRLCYSVIVEAGTCYGYSLWEIYNINPETIRLSSIPKRLQKDSETIAKFFLFCLERQRIWERRCTISDNRFYTNSPVLGKYFFCNNYRELDRGTCYFRSQMLERWQASKENCTHLEWIEIVLWASLCYRLVNKIESFHQLGQVGGTKQAQSPTSQWNRGIPTLEEWPVFKEMIRKCQSHHGFVFFTGAHQTCNLSSYISWMDLLHTKEGQLLKSTANTIYQGLQGEFGQQQGLSKCVKAITTIKGCGDFLSWQVSCDLVESQCLTSCDITNFCVLGKGACLGIQEIFFHGRKKMPSLSKGEYMGYAQDLVSVQDNVYAELKVADGFCLSFPKWLDKSLTLKEVEHALCEFSKFQRIERRVNGEG